MRLGNLRRSPATTNREHGYFLIVVMLFVALLAIASLERVQNVVTELKHDQEEELVHRGAQYARAIKKYYKWSKGRYPTSIDQLEKTNNMRFLRKRYKDPVTGGDFRLLRESDVVFNQGQGAGLSGSGTGNDNISRSTGGNLSSPLAQGILNATGLNGGNPANTYSSGAGKTENASDTQDKSGTDKNFGSTGNTFGGGPFIGVASTSSKTSLKEFNKKNHYKDWMFVYLPLMDRANANGSIALIKGPYVPSQVTGTNFSGGGSTTPLFGGNSGMFSQQPGASTSPVGSSSSSNSGSSNSQQ